MKRWLFPYLFVAAGLTLPTLARIQSDRDPVDVAAFFFVGVVLWGTLLLLLSIAWRTLKNRRVQHAPQTFPPIVAPPSKNALGSKHLLAQLATTVLQLESYDHAAQLAQGLGYRVSASGGSWFTSPSIHVVPPPSAGQEPMDFANWELFLAWVRKAVCPGVLR